MFARKLNADSRTGEALLLSALFESMPEPMLLCDSELVIVASNKAAKELLQVTAGELSGERAQDVLAARSGGTGPICRAGVGWRSEFERHGKLYDLDISGTVVRDESTKTQGWLLVLKPVVKRQGPPEFIGSSQAIVELLEFVSRIAGSRATSILLEGESGTGKELIARRLHALSPRAGAPFVAINCAAIPESLFESELFGHEKGAFTGAMQRKEGLLAAANGGTIFLDEIGDMPLVLQAKLLRVIEEHSFRRLGGTRDVQVNLRFVSATNADLEKAMGAGRFRSDLFYRLGGVQIRLPALRERVEDIRKLALHFLAHFNGVHNRRLLGLEAAAQCKLDLYAWPGNVRELRNVIERAVLMEGSSWITPASIVLGPGDTNRIAAPTDASLAGQFSLRGSELELIRAALEEANGNQSRAARLLGIGRFSLRYKMKALGMI